MSLQTTLYRQLLRLARELDRCPLSKAMLIAQPEGFFDRQTNDVRSLPALDAASAEVTTLLRACVGGEHYMPERSMRSTLLDMRRSMPSTATGVDPVDVGFAALRALGAAASSGAALREHVDEESARQGSELVGAI